MLAGLARTCYRHRRIVAGRSGSSSSSSASSFGGALKGESATNGRLPDTDSQAAYDTLEREFPQRHGDEGQIVFADVTQNRAAIDAYLDEVADVEGVIEVEPIRISEGGKIAVAPITTASGSGAHPLETATDIKDLAKPLAAGGRATSSSPGRGSAKPGCRRARSSASSPRSSCCSSRSAR